ncbi:helix-turn-helix domain-containing protein [Paenibacillus sp. JSM ZJ436]
MSKKNVRWTYENAHTHPGVPELLLLGYDRFQEANGLGDHQHGNCYEIVYVESGKAAWEVNGEAYTTHAGQLFHTRPNELHRGMMNFIEPCTIWWMIFSNPEPHVPWLGLAPEDISHISQQLAVLPRTIEPDPQVRNTFRKLRKILESPTSMGALMTRHYMIDILLLLLNPPVSSSISEDMVQAIHALIDHIDKEPGLRWTNAQLARAVGVSESHFYRLFRSVHGQSPASFVIRTKMEHACRRLENTDTPVTSIAMELGYETSQHFATAFKKYKGVTPREWRLSKS